MTEHPDLVRLAARTRSVLADAVSTVFDPLLLVGVLLLAVGAASHPSPWIGAAWALAAIAGCALAPEAVLRLLVRTGRVRDRQLVMREQRHTPMLVAAGCVVLTLAALMLLGAPDRLVALVVTILAGLCVMALVTRWWKASVHAAVAATCATVTALVFGPVSLLGTLPVVAAVGWARVRRAGTASPRYSPAPPSAPSPPPSSSPRSSPEPLTSLRTACRAQNCSPCRSSEHDTQFSRSSGRARHRAHGERKRSLGANGSVPETLLCRLASHIEGGADDSPRIARRAGRPNRLAQFALCGLNSSACSDDPAQ